MIIVDRSFVTLFRNHTAGHIGGYGWWKRKMEGKRGRV